MAFRLSSFESHPRPIDSNILFYYHFAKLWSPMMNFTWEKTSKTSNALLPKLHTVRWFVNERNQQYFKACASDMVWMFS